MRKFQFILNVIAKKNYNYHEGQMQKLLNNHTREAILPPLLPSTLLENYS